MERDTDTDSDNDIDNDEIDEISYSAMMGHLRSVGKHALFLVILLAVDTGVKYLRMDYLDPSGILRYVLIVVSLVVLLGILGNAIEMFSELGQAGKIAWRLQQVRTAISICLIVVGVALAGGTVSLFTQESYLFDDQLEDAKEDRQEALEKVAAADDPDAVEEHTSEVMAADAEIRKYDRLNRFSRLFFIAAGAFSALFLIGSGTFGLAEPPETEVSAA